MLGRFERKIVLLLVSVAVVPLAGAWIVADRLVAHSLEVGLNPRVGIALEAVPGTFREFVAARKAAYRGAFSGLHRSAALRDALADPAALDAVLRDFMASRDHVVSAAVVRPDGSAVARVEAPAPGPADRWRPLPLSAPLTDLPDGAGLRLEAVFVIGWHHFRAFEEATAALETYRTLMTSREGLAGGYRIAFGVALLTVLLLTALAGLLLARRVTQPIGPLIGATRRVAAGDLAVAAPPGPDDEIGDLCRAFDAMVRQMRDDRDRIAFLTRVGASQDMARHLAHEIKNPLTPITLAVQQLAGRYRGDDETFADRLETTAEIVAEEVGALRRLVDAFLAFAHLPAVELEPSDLAHEVRRFVDAHGRFADVADVEVVAPEQPLAVRLDRGLFRRVLSNLVDNAVEAVPDGRRPRLRLEVVALATGQASVRVEDNGPGIAEAEAAAVFEPYRTTKTTGTGLGLAIARKVVLDHGGDVRVGRSSLGGAVFEVLLPAD